MALWQNIQINPQDKRLLTAFIIAGLVVTGVGGIFALLMLLVRTPVLSVLSANLYYQALTGHGLFMFILWFSFMQTALLIVAGTLLIKQKLWSYPLAWVGFGFMVLAAVLALAGVLWGANITYHGAIPLAEQYSAAWLIYLSYIVLSLGMLIVVVDFLLTILGGVERKLSLNSWAAFFQKIPIASFAAISGLFIAIPGLIAALKTFIPAFLWTLGLSDIDPEIYRMNWHVAFHIYHYIPVLALVGVAYVLVETTAGARSVYAKQVAKALFLLYPFFVPPTFLYHLLADPNIPQNVKFAGTTMSLLVGTPTLLHMFIILGMLEVGMRRAGYGLFNWLKYLPWRNPAFSSMMMGMVTLFVGGLSSYLLLQEQLASMLHSTFAVPAYIHAMAAGGANMMYMGALYYGVPVVLGRQLWGLKLARIQPYLMGGALLWMSIFGMGAGLAGVPRRFASLGENVPASWSTWMNLSLGVGGVLALAAVMIFLLIMTMTALVGQKASSAEQAVKWLTSSPLPLKRTYNHTPVALIPPAAFILGIILLTVLAFNFLWSIPIHDK